MDTFAFGLALAAGFLVAASRMYLMGDLPPVEVLRSSAIWGLGTFMGLGGALWIVSRSLSLTPLPASASRSPQKAAAAARSRSQRAAGRPAAGSAPEIAPEALNQVEEEAVLVERPEPPRIEGAPPPEVAAAIRDLMKDG